MATTNVRPLSVILNLNKQNFNTKQTVASSHSHP